MEEWEKASLSYKHLLLQLSITPIGCETKYQFIC
jgi:hypothetical protein